MIAGKDEKRPSPDALPKKDMMQLKPFRSRWFLTEMIDFISRIVQKKLLIYTGEIHPVH
jgi:hypothetical protein